MAINETTTSRRAVTAMLAAAAAVVPAAVIPKTVQGGLPIYEVYGRDDLLCASEGFLPMIADALQRLTAV